MKISAKSNNFEPCPEYTGRAVCVDVTPLKRVTTAFGDRDVFRFVFEIDQKRDDGSNWCVWSSGFTASLHPKSGLLKFLKQWLGRELTAQELREFDTETLFGKSAFLVVMHNHKDDTTYANIAACTPLKNAEPMKPSGKYKRAIDRDTTGEAATPKTISAPQIQRPAEPQPATLEFKDQLVKVEFKTGKDPSGQPWKAWFLVFENRTEKPGTRIEDVANSAEILTGNEVSAKMKPGRVPGSWELVTIEPVQQEIDDVPF